MGITKTPDGRYLVGKGISDANNYKGALGKRDILIQYTADGVTPDSMNSLLYLVDYATSHGEANELIVPPGISIWVAKNDKLTAVEADDIYIDDDAFHIGPISYDGSDWTFGDPTDTGGSFPTPTADDNGKVLTAGADGTASWQTAGGGGGGNPAVIVTDTTYTLPDGVTTINELVGKPADIYFQLGSSDPVYQGTVPIEDGVIYGNTNIYALRPYDDIRVNSTTSASVGKSLMVYVFKSAGVLESYWYGQDGSGYISLSDNPS